MDRGAWKAAVHGVAEGRTRLSGFTFTFMHWRRKWQPTPCSCLENPRDGGAWWSAFYGVTQSWTRLRRLRKKKKSKSEVQTTNNSHFPGFVSWETPEPNSFSKIWDEVVTGVYVCVCVFYCFQNYTLLSSFIRDSVYLKTMWSCYFVSTLPLTWLGSIFPPKDLWLKYYRENW